MVKRQLYSLGGRQWERRGLERGGESNAQLEEENLGMSPEAVHTKLPYLQPSMSLRQLPLVQGIHTIPRHNGERPRRSAQLSFEVAEQIVSLQQQQEGTRQTSEEGGDARKIGGRLVEDFGRLEGGTGKDNGAGGDGEPGALREDAREETMHIGGTRGKEGPN